MYEQLLKNLKSYWCSITDGEHGTPLKRTLCEAINAIESLQEENKFLKDMQKQLVKGMDEHELGKMVGVALNNRLRQYK